MRVDIGAAMGLGGALGYTQLALVYVNAAFVRFSAPCPAEAHCW